MASQGNRTRRVPGLHGGVSQLLHVFSDVGGDRNGVKLKACELMMLALLLILKVKVLRAVKVKVQAKSAKSTAGLLHERWLRTRSLN